MAEFTPIDIPAPYDLNFAKVYITKIPLISAVYRIYGIFKPLNL